jgi:hypothetical protein
MATGFIYVVRTATPSYTQPAFCNVPTEFDNRLYFGPCKRCMRPRMQAGDFIFGVSPSCTSPRRILFGAEIEEAMTFAEAFRRFPDLRGSEGPIHVRPINGIGDFPHSSYQHIPGSMHWDDWAADLETLDLDRFFVCHESDGWLGRWLGSSGPEIDDEILAFLNTCPAYGSAGYLVQNTGTLINPVAYGRLYTGLHLETRHPEVLVGLCHNWISPDEPDGRSGSGPAPPPSSDSRGICVVKKPRPC